MVRKNFIYCITNRSGGSGDRDGGGGYWLPKVTITAYSETLDPALIWGSNAGNNVGGMFGPMPVSGTRKYWQNMSMGGGGSGEAGGSDDIDWGMFLKHTEKVEIVHPINTLIGRFNYSRYSSKSIGRGPINITLTNGRRTEISIKYFGTGINFRTNIIGFSTSFLNITGGFDMIDGFYLGAEFTPYLLDY